MRLLIAKVFLDIVYEKARLFRVHCVLPEVHWNNRVDAGRDSEVYRVFIAEIAHDIATVLEPIVTVDRQESHVRTMARDSFDQSVVEHAIPGMVNCNPSHRYHKPEIWEAVAFTVIERSVGSRYRRNM